MATQHDVNATLKVEDAVGDLVTLQVPVEVTGTQTDALTDAELRASPVVVGSPLVDVDYDKVAVARDGDGNPTVLTFTLAAVQVAEVTITWTDGAWSSVERTA